MRNKQNRNLCSLLRFHKINFGKLSNSGTYLFSNYSWQFLFLNFSLMYEYQALLNASLSLLFVLRNKSKKQNRILVNYLVQKVIHKIRVLNTQSYQILSHITACFVIKVNQRDIASLQLYCFSTIQHVQSSLSAIGFISSCIIQKYG